MDELTLFPGYEPPPAPDVDQLSADRRRTIRQTNQVSIGVHPLTGGMLHPLASRHRDATAPKDDPFTCGSCLFRRVSKYHDRSYAKCWFPGGMSAEDYEKFGPPRLSHSAASDVRAWWPACKDYSPSDRLSDDAARYIPGGA